MKSELTYDDVIYVATLSPAAEEPRRQQWSEFFGACHVPVTDAEPKNILLPNGTRQDCVFVDFRVGGPALKNRLKEAFQRQNPDSMLDDMLEQDLYPVRLADVTVIKAQRRFWGT